MNKRNPWPGLASYNSSYKFCGRNNCSTEFLNMIENYSFVTLYGKTGVGKTSLLNAGIFPMLNNSGLVPVYIRLGQIRNGQYAKGLTEKLTSEFDTIRHSSEKFDLSSDYEDIDFLWRFFHTRKFTKLGEAERSNFICPVIVLDQFEELFIQDEENTNLLLRQIHLLLSDTLVVPNETGYFTNYNCRFVISIREDRLFYLEEAIDRCNLPELRNNRYRLRPLSKEDAKEVIIIPGLQFIEKSEINDVTDEIIKLTEENGQISSLMLSLVCSQLYDALKDGDKITRKLVVENGINSLKRFYEKTIAVLGDDGIQREKFETLLVNNGHRRPISIKDYKKEIPDGELLYQVDSMKILTKIEVSSSNDEDHTFVELAHDKLAQVIEEIRMDKVLKKAAPRQNFNFDNQIVELSAIEGKKDVFISYKREIVPYVKRLFDELESHDIDVWFDMSELHQDVGKEYTERIHKGIDNSEFFLMIYTKDVEISDFIINEELGYAVKQNKTILFYPKEDIHINNSKLKNYIEKIQWLDTNATAVHQSDTQESISDEKRLIALSSLINKGKSNSIYEDQSLFLIRIALQRILNKTTVFGNYKKLCGTGTKEFYKREQFSIRVINKALFIPVPEKWRKKLELLYFFRKDKLQEVERHLERMKPDNKDLKQQFINFVKNNQHIYSMSIIHKRMDEYLRQDKYKGIELPELNKFGIKEFITIVSEMVACFFISELKDGKTMFNGAELGVYSITDGRTTNSEEHCVDMQLYYSDYFTFKCMTEMYHILCSINEEPFEIKGIRDIKPLAPFFCSLGLGGFLAAYINGNASLMWTKRSDNISSGDIWHFSYDETVSLLLDGIKDKLGHLIVEEDYTVNIDINNILHRALQEEVGVTQAKTEEGKYGVFEVGVIRSERLEIELISQATIYLENSSSPEEQIKEMHESANDGYLEISKVKFFPLRERHLLIGKLLTPESYAIFTRMQNRLIGYVSGKNLILEAGSFIDDGAEIGDNCRIHRNVYIGKNVKIGNNVKIQNNNSIYEGVTLEDGAFIGTNVSFINDRYPRSITRDGRQIVPRDWELEETRVCRGASIGAGAVIMCGVTIGEWAMVAAGSVVLEDVPNGAMVAGNPAKIIKRDIDY